MEHEFSTLKQKKSLPDLDILRDLTKKTGAALQITDVNGVFIYANAACRSLLNIPDQPVESLNFFDFIDAKDISGTQSTFDQMQPGNSSFSRIRVRPSNSEDPVEKLTFFIYKLQASTDHSCKIVGILNQESEVANPSPWAFEEVIDRSDEAIIQLNPQWEIVEINRKGLEFTGYEKQELLGKKLDHLIDPAYLDKASDFYRDQIEKRIPATVYEFPIHSKNGHQRWISQRMHTLLNPQGNISGYLGLCSDITEMVLLKKQLSVTDQVLEKRVNWRTKELERINDKLRNEIILRSATEDALRESQKEYKSLFQNANDAIIIIDAENEKILDVNDLACEMYHLSREEFLKKSFSDTLGSKASSEKDLIIRTLDQKRYNVGEITIEVDGKEMTLDVHANEAIYKGRKAILSVNRDITARKEIQKELLNEKTRVVTALIDGQEMERRRLSRELHDGLGQLLTTSMIYVNQLKKKSNPDSLEIVDRISDILENTMEEVRSISQNLLPSVLDDFGLPLAIKNMVNYLKKNNQTSIQVEVDEKIPRLKPEVEVGLYRIAQEGLNNSLKHANAEKISVRLKKKDQQIELMIRDTGNGFSLNSGNFRKSGNGIANMTQRANSIGCELKINSSKGSGTEINVRYSLNHEQG